MCIYGLNFHCDPMCALDVTFSNIAMLNAVIPNPMDTEERLDADDPENAERINKLILGE